MRFAGRWSGTRKCRRARRMPRRSSLVSDDELDGSLATGTSNQSSDTARDIEISDARELAPLAAATADSNGEWAGRVLRVGVVLYRKARRVRVSSLFFVR